MKAVFLQLALLGLIPFPAGFVHASSSPADSLHFSTFTASAGDEPLDRRVAFERSTPGADGRAPGVLTLGPGPQTKTVEAIVPAPGLLTVSAKGAGTHSTLETGDFRRWHLPPGAILRLGKGLIGRGDRLVSFSPDARLLAVGTYIGVWLYDVATSREVALLPGTYVANLAFSPDGSMLASGGSYRDRTFKLWDVASGHLVETIDLEAEALAFSPDGTTLAFGSNYGIGLWDLATGTRTVTLSHEQNAWGVMYPKNWTGG